AIHPVHVESVAWVTERKNVLSAVFYLLAALAWLRAVRWPLHDSAAAVAASTPEPPRVGKAAAPAPVSPEPTGRFLRVRRRLDGFAGWYAVATLLFLAALLSKTVTCSLPAVLLLTVWWRSGGFGFANWRV